MKIHKIAVSALLIGAGALASYSTALAEQGTVPMPTQNVAAEANTSIRAKIDDDASASADTEASMSAKSSDESESAASSSSKAGAGEEKSDHSEAGDAHRSTVAAFVQSLLHVAGREGGIGVQVKEIAQAQNDSEKATTDALVKIENRGWLKTFFLGADYKNIGAVRSQMVITANHIDRLKKLVDETTNSADKAELQAQIQVLEQEKVKIDAFITSHENKFSLFGWLLH